MALRQGLLQSSHVGIAVGHFLPHCVRFQSQVKLVSIAPSTIGTQNVWNVSAFTQGNDLPWNLQTLFGCSCAEGRLHWGRALPSYVFPRTLLVYHSDITLVKV